MLYEQSGKPQISINLNLLSISHNIISGVHRQILYPILSLSRMILKRIFYIQVVVHIVAIIIKCKNKK